MRNTAQATPRPIVVVVVGIVLVHVNVIAIAIAVQGVTGCLMGYLGTVPRSQPRHVSHSSHSTKGSKASWALFQTSFVIQSLLMKDHFAVAPQ